MNYLLHVENFKRLPLRGWYAGKPLANRVLRLHQETAGKADPDVSIVIRTKNDMAYIKTLFQDIRDQEFTGKIEIIVVDTCSTDGTAEFAKSQGAEVISIKQQGFTYPKALNLGFQVARYPYIVTLVGHSALTSRLFLKSLTRWYDTADFGGVFSWPLPNWNASWYERINAPLWMPSILRTYKVVTKATTGTLGANSAIVSRAAWQELGGFDERYAAGGEDSAFAASMIEQGMFVVREPLCSVFHSHGLGPINSLRQQWHWKQIVKPLPFDSKNLNRRRPDLRRK
jgi:glycosyltransferase involved in cell wall biosynthesis